jgi:hypothetical protein
MQFVNDKGRYRQLALLALEAYPSIAFKASILRKAQQKERQRAAGNRSNKVPDVDVLNHRKMARQGR